MRKSCSVLISTMLMALALPAKAEPPKQPPRWVNADDVRVRSGPSADKDVVGRMSRGTELILKAPPYGDFCLIEGEGYYGYVACRFLSEQKILRPAAGVDGVDAAQRWVNGNGVVLRAAPNREAEVLARLSLNRVVKVSNEQAGNGYCEVSTADGIKGYTACQYLSNKQVVLAHIRGDRQAGQPVNAEYNPEKVFWLNPDWVALEQYAGYLKEKHPNLPAGGPWPKDAALEKMKAHLALGLQAPKPPALTDWAALKQKAAKASDDDMEEIRNKIRIWGDLHDVISSQDRGGAGRVRQLIQALEFQTVQPSLFLSEADIGPGGAGIVNASGRFGIVYRQLTTPRPRKPANPDDPYGPGLYDMKSRIAILAKPVQEYRLFRDGRLKTQSTYLKVEEELWREFDEPMCSGWTPGFTFGDADDGIWRYFEYGAAEGSGEAKKMQKESRQSIEAGALYLFYTTAALPAQKASVSESKMAMDRKKTGFVRGTHLYYDLNGDGIPDIAVWEGTGKGPGHLGFASPNDDRWYRLMLANINGQWKILDADQFVYGCGC